MKIHHAAFMSDCPPNISYVYSAGQRKLIGEMCDLVPETVTSGNFAALDLSGVEVIFSTWGMLPLTAEQLEKMPRLQAVFYAAGATDAFAGPLLERGIRIVSAWKANAVPVAEFVTAQIVLALKNYFSNTAEYKCRAAWETAPKGPGCYGETVALIGAGAISRLVAEKLKAYQVKVVTVPSRPERRTVSIEDAFRTAYVVSNHLPDRDDNKKVLTKAMFASMRRGAAFINTGRGAQVDETGLAEVLKSRPDLTALIDVTWPEPPDPDSPLYRLPNAHLTTHIAGSLNDEVHRMADWMIADFRRFAAGEALENEVTADLLMTGN